MKNLPFVHHQHMMSQGPQESHQQHSQKQGSEKSETETQKENIKLQ